MFYIEDCPASDEQRGPCRRSSDAMVMWRSQIDMRCVCNQKPHMMSQPGPKPGTRSSNSNRTFDQNNTCSLRGPREATYKICLNNTTAEALRRSAAKVRGPIQLSWTVHAVRLSWATRSLGCRSPATCSSCFPSSGYALQATSPNWCRRCRLLFGHHVSD